MGTSFTHFIEHDNNDVLNVVNLSISSESKNDNLISK